MRVFLRPLPILAVLVLGAGLAAQAQSLVPRVNVTVGVEREVVRVADDGTTVVEREPVDIARPGDVLVYTVRAVNVGDAPARSPRIEDPIPDGTVLVVDSVDADAARATASLDGGRSWVAFPATRSVREADGNERTVPVPPEDYTHLRWTLDGALSPGAARDLSFKVRVR
jgi:uncharacterized repeat protein (TIGR01451 family)